MDEAELTLVHGYPVYRIDLEEIDSSAAVLDWIFQIVGTKDWATAEVVEDLLRAFRDVLDPQKNYCADGADLRAHGGQLARKFIQKSHKKLRRPAKKLTFTRWLKTQKNRNDGIGDLAKDVCLDRDGPKDSGTFEHWKSHFRRIGASQGAMDALIRAKAEFEQLG